MLRRQARRRDDGPGAETARAKGNIREPAIRIRNLLLVHQFKQGRNFGDYGISCARGLDKNPHNSGLVPVNERLPGEKCRGSYRAAMNFATLQRQILLRPTWITRDDLKFETQSLL